MRQDSELAWVASDFVHRRELSHRVAAATSVAKSAMAAEQLLAELNRLLFFQSHSGQLQEPFVLDSSYSAGCLQLLLSQYDVLVSKVWHTFANFHGCPDVLLRLVMHTYADIRMHNTKFDSLRSLAYSHRWIQYYCHVNLACDF